MGHYSSHTRGRKTSGFNLDEVYISNCLWWRASSSNCSKVLRNSARFWGLALLSSLRAFFQEKPNFLRLLRIVSRQQLKSKVFCTQSLKRFNVQRGWGFSVRFCGGVAANLRASLSCESTAEMILGDKGGDGHRYADRPRPLDLIYCSDEPTPLLFGDCDCSAEPPESHFDLGKFHTELVNVHEFWDG